MKKLFKYIYILTFLFTLAIFGVNETQALNIEPWASSAYSNLLKNGCLPDVLISNSDYRENITRKNYTVLVMNYYNLVKPGSLKSEKSPFKDTKNPLVAQAARLKIVNGYSDSTFKPDNPITRSEAAVILYNCQKLLGNKYSYTNLETYRDSGMIPNWARQSISALTGANIFKGYPGNKFYPQKNISKQEAFVIVNKVLTDALNTRSKFEIAKDDSYMTKFQYDFVLNNIPTKKFKMEDVKNSINDTDIKIRQSIYKSYIKRPSNTSYKIITSPNLVFSSGYFYYVMGIELKKIDANSSDQRAFLDEITITNSNIERSQKQYSPWFTVE